MKNVLNNKQDVELSKSIPAKPSEKPKTFNSRLTITNYYATNDDKEYVKYDNQCNA